MTCNPICDPCACTSSGFSPVPMPWNPSISPDEEIVEVSEIQIYNASYFTAGKVCWFQMYASFTLELIPPAIAGPAYMLFTLPFPAKNEFSFGGACSANPGPGFIAVQCFMKHLSNIQVRVGAMDPNKWTEGTFRTIIAQGFYELL